MRHAKHEYLMLPKAKEVVPAGLIQVTLAASLTQFFSDKTINHLCCICCNL
jgi:hypothetical protein